MGLIEPSGTPEIILSHALTLIFTRTRFGRDLKTNILNGINF